MPAFDASSMIYAWDNYPPQQFPPLWTWIEGQIRGNAISIPKVAFDEIQAKSPDCGAWLEDKEVTILEITGEILLDAQRIKQLLGIVDDSYRANGVGENDLLIIAAARSIGAELVSEERRQPNVPRVPSNRKIPAVCVMPEVAVPHMNFVEYLKQSGAVFG
jgi:hypothetical protein